MKDWLVVIPARLASTRLPKKPLQLLNGEPLILVVYKNLLPLKQAGAHIVAAIDSKEVESLCLQESIPFVMTDESHASGTDRCNQVVQRFSQTYVMNVQGDEPFVNIDDLKRLAREFEVSKAKMGTLGYKSRDQNAYVNPNDVKIVTGSSNQAIYFSRSPVPFDREAMRLGNPVRDYWRHVGIYAFRRESLAEFCALPTSPLEDSEKLEQLRAISAGWVIHLSEAAKPSLGIDTPEDLKSANQYLKSNTR